MQTGSLNLGDTGFDQLISRKSPYEDPHFDITAMVDLVFMMNIYFLVTFVLTVAAGITLPAAVHCAPLDADTAVVITITRGLDGKSADVFLGNDVKGTPLHDPAEQEKGVQTWAEEAVAAGKTAVLIKAERNVRLGDLHRISTAATVEGMTLHVAVMEKDQSE